MKRFTTLSTLLLLGTTVSYLVTTWLQPNKINPDISGEDYHLYL